MKIVLNYLLYTIIFFMVVSCKNEMNDCNLNKDKYIKNLVFSGDKNRIVFYKIKTKKILNKNDISFVYFEKHEFQTFDTLMFKKNEIYYRGNKLLKIDSMNVNFKNKKITINKLLYPDIYPQKYLIFYVSKEIGIISNKSNYNNVHIFYDIENNYDLNNKVVNHNFLKHDLEK
ncbi:hypothetical protein [Flavobacterium sp. ov086]|uniref:hypothetical protein n=1 Tax=Flavobacterium sp. ov086 TaxID=1761785 RepID=UPI000B634C88|nr:hypothetical protein [Flavobacterium sp. ov086]SNR81504.1 hypothetical protein SAMN04487979_1232 [Flavobacterium sp. ov086]